MKESKTIIDTGKILEKIVNSEKFGESFIPEVDGKKMLIEMLPIEQAKIAGKGSEIYNTVIVAYKTIMEDIVLIQKGLKSQITSSIPIKNITTSYDDTTREILHKRSTGPYRGVYGHWK
ncbi:MAG: hypothetical protein ACP5OA_04910 [Candidatus Woesearchaeota archaeon]